MRKTGLLFVIFLGYGLAFTQTHQHPVTSTVKGSEHPDRYPISEHG